MNKQTTRNKTNKETHTKKSKFRNNRISASSPGVGI
jgi:hypothetical protein